MKQIMLMKILIFMRQILLIYTSYAIHAILTVFTVRKASLYNE